VQHLRRKLRECGAQELIATVRSIGYRFVEDD
jgi:DNA-binding response OmpR family regulator